VCPAVAGKLVKYLIDECVVLNGEEAKDRLRRKCQFE